MCLQGWNASVSRLRPPRRAHVQDGRETARIPAAGAARDTSRCGAHAARACATAVPRTLYAAVRKYRVPRTRTALEFGTCITRRAAAYRIPPPSGALTSTSTHACTQDMTIPHHIAPAPALFRSVLFRPFRPVVFVLRSAPRALFSSVVLFDFCSFSFLVFILDLPLHTSALHGTVRTVRARYPIAPDAPAASYDTTHTHTHSDRLRVHPASQQSPTRMRIAAHRPPH